MAVLFTIVGCTSPEKPIVETPKADAQAWVTTSDRKELLARLPTSSNNGSADEISIDPGSARQVVDGFGAALTHSSARLLTQMPSAARADLLRELFDPDGETRLSVLRVPLGGSDFVAEAAYTYDDLPLGEEDWDLSRFSTAADEDELRPLLRQILAIAPELTIIAAPWSPPAWLKQSRSLSGGRLRDEERAYDTYAAYLDRAVEEYGRAGVPIDYLTVQNEPQARNPDGYPGTDMPADDQIRLIAKVGPLLASTAPDTHILAYDHNWSLHAADAGDAADGQAETEYPAKVLRSDAGRWVAGVAYHCYSGDPTRQSRLHDEFPAASIHVTECSGSHDAGDTPERVFADTFKWQSRTLLLGSLGNWASTILTWNLVLDPSGGPHIGGCNTCTGVVTVRGDGDVALNAEYYVLAHASRFVPPGSTTLNTSNAEESPLSHTAFLTPRGVIVALIYNDGQEQRLTSVAAGTDKALVMVPAASLVTIEIHPGAR
jgi:glucosylceramidase